MNWIKLTSVRSEWPVYVNLAKALAIERVRDDERTRISFDMDVDYLDVQETPEQIFKAPRSDV